MVNGSQRNVFPNQGIALAELAEVAAACQTSRISAEGEVLSTRIERAVRRKTNGKIHGLKVEVHRERILLHGHCGTFYSKQLAQQAALSLLSGQELQDMIEVW